MAAASRETETRSILQGRYRLLERLGDHAGEVFVARRARDGQSVVIRLWPAPSPQLAAAFAEIARQASRVHHTALPGIEACGREADGQCFVVSEHVAGVPLDKWADKVGIPAFENVVEIGRTLCGALQAAHGAGATHGALRPGNVRVLQEVEGPARPLQVKLLDLGVPTFIRARVPNTQAARFMAPEHLAATLAGGLGTLQGADAVMSVYSLGCILYQLCTGGPPFRSATIDELKQAHGEGKLQRPSRINPQIPAGLEAVILRALAIAPQERFADPEALSRALAEVELNPGSGVRARSVPPPPPAPTVFEERSTRQMPRPPRARTETPLIDLSDLALVDPDHDDTASSLLPRTLSLPVPERTPERTKPRVWWPMWTVMLVLIAAGTVQWRTWRERTTTMLAQHEVKPHAWDAPEITRMKAGAGASAPAPSVRSRPPVVVTAEPEPEQHVLRARGVDDDEPVKLAARSHRSRGRASAEVPNPYASPTPTPPQQARGLVAADPTVLRLMPAPAAGAPAQPTEPEPEAVPPPVVQEPVAVPPSTLAPSPPPSAAPTVGMPRTTRPAPPAALRGRARLGDLQARGSLPSALVRRALQRVQPSLDACYTRAAQLEGRNAFGAVHVELEIDERGRARDAHASGSLLPGVDRCVAGAMARVVSERAPDTGTVKVSFDAVFEP